MSIDTFYDKVNKKIVGKEFVLLFDYDYKLTSDVYIRSCVKTNSEWFAISMADPKTFKIVYARINEDINNRFDKNKVYKVYYHIHYKKTSTENYQIDYVNIDRIDDLLSIADYNAIKAEENNKARIEKEERTARENLRREEERKAHNEYLAKKGAKYLSLVSVFLGEKIDIGQKYFVRDPIFIENKIGINRWSVKSNDNKYYYVLEVPEKYQTYIKQNTCIMGDSFLIYKGRIEVETINGFLRMVDLYLLDEVEVDKIFKLIG
jgi:hypothetical protein